MLEPTQRRYARLLSWVMVVLFATFSTYAGACTLRCAANVAGYAHTGTHAGDGSPSGQHVFETHADAKPLVAADVTTAPPCHCVAIGQPSARETVAYSIVAATGHDAVAPEFASHVTAPPEPLPKRSA